MSRLSRLIPTHFVTQLTPPTGKKGGGGGGNKRARDGDGSAADMEAPSKKPALETGEALLFYLPRVALPTVQYRT